MEELINKVDRLLHSKADHKSYLEKQIKNTYSELGSIRKQVEIRDNALLVFDYLIEQRYGVVVQMFEETITSGLMDVFNDDYAFKFLIGRRGKSITADYGIKTGEYEELKDLAYTQGRSVKSVVSAIIRFVVLTVDSDMPDYIFLDEQFFGIEEHRMPLIMDFIKKVAEKFSIQVVLITQNPELRKIADNTIKLKALT